MGNTLTNDRWRAAVAALIARDGQQCHYCGRTALLPLELHAIDAALKTMPGIPSSAYPLRYTEIYRQALVLDHKAPRAAGGKNDLDNLLIACAYCNGVKSNRPYELAKQIIRARVLQQGENWGRFRQERGGSGAAL